MKFAPGIRTKTNNPDFGISRTPGYLSWYDMMRRCFNPSHATYARWGGRGITVSPELQTFRGFLAVLGPKPEGMTLDRINNEGHYEPGNVRWATPLQQQQNTRWAKLITHQGKTQSIAAWARELDMKHAVIWSRLYRWNYSIEDALTKPAVHWKLTAQQVIEIFKSKEPQDALAARFGVSQSQVSRIQLGLRWSHLTGIGRNRARRAKRP